MQPDKHHADRRPHLLGLSGVWTALAVTSIAKGVTFALAFRHVSGRLMAERTGR